MAKNSKQTPLSSLVGTQREALAALNTKRALAELAVELAQAHGTEEQQAQTTTDLKRRARAEIEAFLAEVALRAQRRRRAHLSELGGWPVCWSDAKREAVEALELLATPIAVDEEAVTCTRCKKVAELPSPEETAAFKRAEAEAARSPRKAKASGPKKPKAKARAKRQLRLDADLPVRLKVKDVEVKGTLRTDGTLRAKSKTYDSPHAAANALAGDQVNYRIDGFQAWRFADEDGRWRALRDHA